MLQVTVIGELNVDLIFSGCSQVPAFGAEVTVNGFAMTLGSASAICAVGLARLGRPVSFVGKVGADSWGDYCLQALRAAGVDVSDVRREKQVQTGVTVAPGNVINARSRGPASATVTPVCTCFSRRTSLTSTPAARSAWRQ